MPVLRGQHACQRQQRSADLVSLLRDRKLLLTYFGTNWDHRRKNFFRMLSEIDNVQICGPTHSWPEIHRKSYGGSLEFDGDAVQARYATNGLGLCLVSELHCRDDVISNRIFEIASVGAIALTMVAAGCFQPPKSRSIASSSPAGKAPTTATRASFADQ